MRLRRFLLGAGILCLGARAGVAQADVLILKDDPNDPYLERNAKRLLDD